MRRIILALVILTAVASLAFGQEFGPTWIDSGNGGNVIYPTSILASTTDGAFTDEIDIVLRSPLGLGEYEGYGIFTLYGNYSSPWGVPYNNPFTTVNPDVDLYQFGATMPVNDAMRAGFVGRYFNLIDNRIEIAGEFFSSIEGSSTDTTYDGAGEVTITETTTEQFAFNDVTNQNILGAGLTMGNLAVSLSGVSFGTSRTVGGSSQYTYTPATGFDPAAVETTSESYLIGSDAEGAPKRYPAPSDWNVTALGQLPLALIGTSSPVTAFVRVGGAAGAVNPLLDQVKTTYARTDTDYTVADDPQTTTTIVYGEALGGTWTPAADINEPAGVVLGTDASGLPLYYDLENTSRGVFGFDAGGGIDPVIPLAERVTLNAKAHVGFGFESGNFGTAEASSVRIVDPDQTWESTYTETAPEKVSTFDISSDLGGRIEFRDEAQVVTLSTGLFVQPALTRESTTLDTSTTILTNTSTGDALGTTTEAALTGLDAATAAAAIDAATAGTSTLTTTTTYAGADSESTFSLDFVIPTSVRMDLREGKVSLIGGYNIRHTQSYTTAKTGAIASTTTSAVVQSGGTTVYDETDEPVGATVTTPGETTEKSSTSAPWAGQMAWMVRWMPFPSVTVDLEGTGIMNALDMDIFGGGTSVDPAVNDGFNPNFFIDQLLLSVSFRF